MIVKNLNQMMFMIYQKELPKKMNYLIMLIYQVIIKLEKNLIIMKKIKMIMKCLCKINIGTINFLNL